MYVYVQCMLPRPLCAPSSNQKALHDYVLKLIVQRDHLNDHISQSQLTAAMRPGCATTKMRWHEQARSHKLTQVHMQGVASLTRANIIAVAALDVAGQCQVNAHRGMVMRY